MVLPFDDKAATHPLFATGETSSQLVPLLSDLKSLLEPPPYSAANHVLPSKEIETEFH